MDYEQLHDLIEQVDQSSLREFDLKYGDVEVRMSKNTSPLLPQHPTHSTKQETSVQEEASQVEPTRTPQQQPSKGPDVQNKDDSTSEEAVPETGHVVTSPIVGVVYLSPAPGEPVFVQEGDRVVEGDTLCIVEAMKVMNEMKSDVAGTIKRVVATDKTAVEYNQPLFIIQTEE